MFGRINNALKLATLIFGCVILNTQYSMAAEITAIDFNGKVLGQVISSGMVINSEGENIGSITADSLVISDDGKILGGVLPQGIVMGNDNKLLGKISGDGIVRSFAGKELGRGLPNGLVINNKDEIIGAILFPGLIYSDDGTVVGRMTGAGTYIDLDGQELGFVSAGGYAYRKSNDEYAIDGKLLSSKMVVSNEGKFLGSVAPSGEVMDFEGKKVGNIHANGYVYDESGKIIGRIVTSGYVFDFEGRYIGFISYNGAVVNASGEEIGSYRADGKVADNDGKIIGYVLNISASASDVRGNYLGRVIPEGMVIRGSEKIGHIGAKNYVYNDAGEFIGQVIKTGPVFDALGNLKGEGMPNGALVAPEGSVIGRTIGDYAYNTNGLMIGGFSKDMIAVNTYNKVLGISGVSGTIKDGEEKNIVSPYGYLLNSEKKIVGSNMPVSSIYNLEGALYSDIKPDGKLYRGAEGNTLTPAGVVLNKDGYIGSQLDYAFAYNQSGEKLGYIMNNNTLMNNDGEIAYKITPDNYVVETLGQSENNVMPLAGYAGKNMVAVSIGGDLLGYVRNDGQITDLSANTKGRLMYGNYVSDTSGAIGGKALPFISVQNDKCDVVGVMNGHGDIINSREVIVGRILANGQAISDAGSYLGYGIIGKNLVDFDGNVRGVVNNGSGLDYLGNNLGCINRKGIITDDANKWKYGLIIQDSVIDFENNIIGQVQADGSVANAKNSIIGYMQPNGNVVSKSKKVLGNVMRYKVAFDEQNKFLGMVKNSGAVIGENGKNVGQVMFDGSVMFEGETVGYALYDFYAYDENFIVYGYFAKDGTVLSSVGSKLGELEHGFVLNRENKPVARGNRDYTIRDVSHNALGELGFDGNVRDYENQNIGYIGSTGEIKNSNGDVIARANPLQYYHGQYSSAKVAETEDWADNKRVGVQDERKPAEKGRDSSRVKDLSKKIIGIALSPDGDIIGDIYEDNTVRDANGVQKGFRTSDGIIVDMDYNPIGIEEIKRTSADSMFVPAGTFGNGNAYGIGSQPSNLGPGGGFGQGERYDPARARALSQLQQMRRKNISVKPISSNFEISSFTGYEEDGWPGMTKNISSWRVDMSQMILEDKPIPAVLARSIYASESFSQNVPVTAIVERNIYAEDGRNIIIPAGSRAIGSVAGNGANSGGNSGSAVKIGINWKRIIRPDGAQFLLTSAQTADAQGRAGALGYLDEQLLKRYTTPLMVSTLSSATAYVTAASKGTTSTSSNGATVTDSKSEAANQARENFLEQMDQMFQEILQDKIKIKSVTYVPAGTRIIIFPNEDLWLNNEKRNTERKNVNLNSNERGLTSDETDARKDTVTVGSAGGGNKIDYDEEYEEEVAPASLTTSNPTSANTRKRRQTTVPAATQQSAPSSGGNVGAVPELM